MFATETQGKDVIIRIVHACRTAMHLSDIFATEVTGGASSVFDTIYGELEDALYIMNQEHTQELKESTVDQLLRNKDLSDESVTETLYQLIQAKVRTTPHRRKLTATSSKYIEEEIADDDDDLIVSMTNEAWMPDDERKEM